MNRVEKFKIESAELRTIAADFCAQIERGIQDQASCFKMLNSYLPRAIGQECGRYIALDFGGTNVRALLVELQGMGQVRILDSAIRKIPAQLTDSSADARQLFAFIAQVVSEIVKGQTPYALAHTFSFPVRQTDANRGVLVEWAKEFATAGVVGCDVNELLSQALSEQGLDNVQPVVLLNDTVATLLAASYTDPDTVIGSICGTGHNTAFFDGRGSTIVNLESGNFNMLVGNEYDRRLDSNSKNPARQRLEKMTAGRYLGEIFRLAAKREDFSQPFSLDTQLLADIIAGQDARFDSIERELARAIVRRAAALVAASYAGVLMYLELDTDKAVSIAVDGSLYDKMPLYADGIRETLGALLGDRVKNISIFAENRGSSVGAAVAAALVEANCIT